MAKEVALVRLGCNALAAKVSGFGILLIERIGCGDWAVIHAKGEAFRDASIRVMRAKVRIFGKVLGLIGWKCPADGGGDVRCLPVLDFDGEVFRGDRWWE